MYALLICSIQLLLWKRKWSTPRTLFTCFLYCSSFSKVTQSNNPYTHISTLKKKKGKKKAQAQIWPAGLTFIICSNTFFIFGLWLINETKNSSHPQSTVCVGGMFCTQNYPPSSCLSHSSYTSPLRQFSVKLSEAYKAGARFLVSRVHKRKFSQAWQLLTPRFALQITGRYFTS